MRQQRWGQIRSVMTLWLGITLVSLAGCSDGPPGPPGERIDLGTHTLHLYCLGQGQPTVVIDTGWGDTADSWHDLQSRLSVNTRVCTYDRAGYGWSEPGPMPRTSGRVADELNQLLGQAEEPGPFVLVGHSLGGLNMRLFAARYPAQVAALVLLDPPPRAFLTGEAFPELREVADQTTHEVAQSAEAAQRASDPAEQARAAYYRMMASEHEMMFTESIRELDAVALPQTPFVVMASGRVNPAMGETAAAFQRFWVEESRSLVEETTQGHFVFAEESGHYFHVDVPDRVLETILEVVQEGRGDQDSD